MLFPVYTQLRCATQTYFLGNHRLAPARISPNILCGAGSFLPALFLSLVSLAAGLAVAEADEAGSDAADLAAATPAAAAASAREAARSAAFSSSPSVAHHLELSEASVLLGGGLAWDENPGDAAELAAGAGAASGVGRFGAVGAYADEPGYSVSAIY